MNNQENWVKKHPEGNKSGKPQKNKQEIWSLQKVKQEI